MSMGGVTAEPGTYRAADGRLVHCRLHDDGELIIEIDLSPRPIRTHGPCCLSGTVKLSDDPCWPDLDERTGPVWLSD